MQGVTTTGYQREINKSARLHKMNINALSLSRDSQKKRICPRLKKKANVGRKELQLIRKLSSWMKIVKGMK